MYQEDIPQSYLWTNTIHNRKNKNVHLSTAYYNKVIKKLNFDVYFTTNLYQELPLNEYYFDKDNAGTIRGLQYENSFKLNTIDYISGIKFYYKPTDKLIINFGTAFQSKHNDFNFLSIDEDRQLKNSYWLPNINIRYKNLEARWSMDVENPNTYAIQTQLNDLDNNYITLPSLNFNPVKKQNAVLSYNKYNNKYQLGGNINMNYEDRSIGYLRIRNPDNGQITFQQKETGSTYRFHSYGYFRYNFKSGKDWQYYVSTNPSIYTYQQYQSINSIDNKLQSIGGNISQEFSIRWKRKIGIAPKYTFNANRNKNAVQDNPDFRDATYITHGFGASLNIIDIKKITLETTYMLNNRASSLNERDNFHILNSSLYYTLKNNGQIKLTGFDILNQNLQNYWGRSANSTYFNNSLTLRQYFLLGYVHKFNIVK